MFRHSSRLGVYLTYGQDGILLNGSDLDKVASEAKKVL